MVKLPENPKTLKFQLDSKTTTPRRSVRIGMASIGDACRRRLWFKFRWASPLQELPSRVNRIFKFGDMIEELAVAELTEAGYNITDQQDPVEGFAGHAFGYTDGLIHNVPEAPKTPHLFECKSMKASSFRAAVKRNDVRVSEPKHYAQMQRYMHAKGLTRALYFVVCKDTSEVHIERVYYDKGFSEDLVRKEMDIIIATEPPTKEFIETQFECKFCDHKDVCHRGARPERNCRTCENVDLEEGGIWRCTLDGKKLEVEDQLKGCGEYTQLAIGIDWSL